MKVRLDHRAQVGATSADLLRSLCSRQAFRDVLESFWLNYDAILAELLALCSAQTLVRTMTYKYPALSDDGLDEHV